MDKDQLIIRGNQAAELLQHPLLVEAFELIDARIKSEWEASPARDTEGRERLWIMSKLLNNLKSHLQDAAESGDLAKLNLEQQKTWLQKVQTWDFD